MGTEIPNLTGGSRELTTSGKAAEIPETEKEIQTRTRIEKPDLRNEKILIGIPILFIALAELLIYSGKAGTATWIHIGTIIALTLSTLLVRDRQINRTHQALMLPSVLRLVNLSMPVFFDVTLYSFIFIYGALAIPVAVAARAQEFTRKQMGLVFDKRTWTYLLLAILLGFFLGYGEYSIIHTGYLIPDLSFLNVLKLTIIMVFFVGLIEEIIFRSILQTRLEETFGLKTGMIAASLLFGLMHSGYGTPYEMFYMAFVGLFMGYLFQKTRSLPFITLLHGFVNVFLFGIIPHIAPAGSFF
ncbi:MAG: CPBP family intramembrane metalloprotease [Methanosarcinaceae archaeon]|nr:CPBP family intramembrane metalloprotease [Methanosarcinaceae archaeon]